MRFEKRSNYVNEQTITALSCRHSISVQTARLLAGRGMSDQEQIECFLHPERYPLSNPADLKGAANAAQKIAQGIQDAAIIHLWAHADADGILALNTAATSLAAAKAAYHCRLIDRDHNLNQSQEDQDFLFLAKQTNLHILLGADDSDEQLVEQMKQNGQCIVITNKKTSLCDEGLSAFVTSRYSGSVQQDLSLAALCAKVMSLWAGSTALEKCRDLLFLASALSGCSIKEENRQIYVQCEKDFLASSRCLIREILQQLEPALLPASTLSQLVLRRVRPLMESAIRMGQARLLASSLFASRTSRQFLPALEALCNQAEAQDSLIRQNISNGALGQRGVGNAFVIEDNAPLDRICKTAEILSRQAEQPMLILSRQPAGCIGAVVSSGSFRVQEVLAKEGVLFRKGRTIPGYILVCDNAQQLCQRFNRAIQMADPALFEEIRQYDMEVSIRDLSDDLAAQLSWLAPFGPGNPAATFLIQDGAMKTVRLRGKNAQNFACELYDETGSIKAMAFDMDQPAHRIGNDFLVSLKIQDDFAITHKGALAAIRCIRRSDNHKERDLANQSTRYGSIDPKLAHPLSVLGLWSTKEKQFNSKNIFSIGDLLHFFPRRYYDFRRSTCMDNVRSTDEKYRVEGTITHITSTKKGIVAIASDPHGKPFRIFWFNQSWIMDHLKKGDSISVCGSFRFLPGGPPAITPLFWSKNPGELNRLIPVYSKIRGMSDTFLENTVQSALEYIDNADYLEIEIARKYNLPCLYDTYRMLHRPQNDLDLEDGARRTVFDSLLQSALLLKARESKAGGTNDFAWPIADNHCWKILHDALPYCLTEDQKTALSHMWKTICRHERLNALVQGDVGSGKTIVAVFMMAAAAANGLQAVMLAPTEVLAAQHFEEVQRYGSLLGLETVLLSGSVKAREKKAILKDIADGQAKLIVGTHALLQKNVEFDKLGLLVIDEQHKFGVEQRELLTTGQMPPHVINMSATPIPRTMAQAFLGIGIQIENIKTRPQGRKPVITQLLTDDTEINQKILEQVQAGHQCYVVCPAIDEHEDDNSSISSVEEVKKEMEAFFRHHTEVQISAISGRMKSKEITANVEAFASRKTNVLISTTIVEVGVNIPNATLMVIKNAERFGLAQAHQLRGRVGRGSDQGYCILQTRPDDPKANILLSTSDGFEIASQDLRLRGTGSLVGNIQSGKSIDTSLILSHASQFEQIQQDAAAIITSAQRKSVYAHLLCTA